MKSKGNIVFLGMMGSGKTLRLANYFRKNIILKFYDTDHFIEE